MAPRRKIRSAEELESKIDDFIRHCEDNDIEPDDYELCNYLVVSATTLERWRYNDGGKYDGYGDALKKLILYRERYYKQLAKDNPKLSSLAIFALKQAKNGGYVDKPVVNVEAKELKIVTDGVGDGAFD